MPTRYDKYLSNSQFELISSDSNNPNTVFTISKI